MDEEITPKAIYKNMRSTYVNHKRRSRHITRPEELEERQNELKKKLQAKTDGDSDLKKIPMMKIIKLKGVSSLIENHNRVQKKSVEEVTNVNMGGEMALKPELSRREREELEKQKA